MSGALCSMRSRAALMVGSTVFSSSGVSRDKVGVLA